MNIIDLLAHDNYLIVNKSIAKELGLDTAIILGELACEYNYWYSQGKLENDYFFTTIENIQDNTTLTRYQQTKALTTLKDLDLIDIQVKGMPAKRYIRFNQEQVCKLLTTKFVKNLQTSMQKTDKQVCKKLAGNNNNIKIINNNNYILDNNKEELEDFYQSNLSETTKKLLNRKRFN